MRPFEDKPRLLCQLHKFAAAVDCSEEERIDVYEECKKKLRSFEFVSSASFCLIHLVPFFITLACTGLALSWPSRSFTHNLPNFSSCRQSKEKMDEKRRDYKENRAKGEEEDGQVRAQEANVVSRMRSTSDTVTMATHLHYLLSSSRFFLRLLLPAPHWWSG